MEKFLKSNWGIPILITILFFCILPVFFLHQGFLLIDTGREFYIPQQMLNGEVLYKDIFNIYGPLSYQINAILFAIFGIKINTLYLFGILNSYLIVLLSFLISREFLKESRILMRLS
jgi:predicted membrane-bound mannosyltransferase